MIINHCVPLMLSFVFVADTLFILAWYIQYPSASSFENWLSMSFPHCHFAWHRVFDSYLHFHIWRLQHTLGMATYSVYSPVLLQSIACS